jgi:hypothetical protein
MFYNKNGEMCIRKFLIFLLLVVILGMSFGFAAENETGNASENDLETVLVVPTSDDNVFKSNISGEEYNGLCLNYSLYGPVEPTYYNSSNNTDQVDQRIKNIVIKNYRHDNDPNTNFVMSIAIAKIVYNYQDGILEDWFSFTLEERDLFDKMLNDHTGIVGNTYTDAEKNVFTFTFKFLTTNNKILSQTLQDLIMFRYDISNESDTNITEPDTKNTTEEPDTNITEPDTNNTIEEPGVNVTDPVINNSSSVNVGIPEVNGPNEDNNIGKSISNPINMKETGIPLIALLVLISGIGVFLNRRK